MLRSADVYFKDEKCGVLSETEDGFEFKYDDDYLKKPDALPISMSMRLTHDTFKSGSLFPFFDGLIPEGWLLKLITEKWGIDPKDRFSILLRAGDDTIGAVSLRGKN